MKGICKARVIVATRQKREIIMQSIKSIFLFFIVHQLTHLPNTLACIWNIYVRSAHIAVNLCACFIRKIAKCQDVKSFLSAYGAPWLFALSPIPHLRSFFFCAVINTYFKRFCFKPALGAVHINGHWSPAYTIYTPKFRIRTTARTLF